MNDNTIPCTVAVIIVSYNSGEMLARCLDCILRQTREPDKIVIVDNNSTDEASRKHLTQIEASDIDIVRMTENVGYGAAINHAVKLIGDVDYICTLNPDAYPEPNWLEVLVKAAERNPIYGSFASLMIQTDGTCIDGAGDVLHISGLPWRRFHGEPLACHQLQTEPQFSACGGAAMYWRHAFDAVDGFDESFFMFLISVAFF